MRCWNHKAGFRVNVTLLSLFENMLPEYLVFNWLVCVVLFYQLIHFRVQIYIILGQNTFELIGFYLPFLILDYSSAQIFGPFRRKFFLVVTINRHWAISMVFLMIRIADKLLITRFPRRIKDDIICPFVFFMPRFRNLRPVTSEFKVDLIFLVSFNFLFDHFSSARIFTL